MKTRLLIIIFVLVLIPIQLVYAPPTPNPQYIANHEFGHLAGLNHAPVTDSNSHTAMKTACNPGQASIKTADFNQINGLYNP